MSVPRVRRFGTRRDRPDARDSVYRPTIAETRLPAHIDLRPLCPPVEDQRHLNSCSAHAIAAALWMAEPTARRHRALVSRLFIYYNERAKEGVVDHNACVSLRDGYHSVARQGACPERLWPYDTRRFRRRPSSKCYELATHHRAIRYLRLTRSVHAMKDCLAHQHPFAIGMDVYRSFMSPLVARTGAVPMPRPGRERLIGGHAVLVVGYIDAIEQFIVRNSWGTTWGMGGYFLLPYHYVLGGDHAYDFWTLQRTL